MDQRLFEAARTGNTEYLQNLLKDNPLLLDTVALAGGENPLHIACIVGHADFARDLIKLKREFAAELNQDGLSPFHIASANGNMDIVKLLLNLDHNLCQIKGREQTVPLHYAAIKGRVRVVTELIAASPDCITDCTARNETALHLAVTNYQFEAFGVLVEHLKKMKKEEVLNKKDDQGNTILHVAISKRQYEVVKFLLREQVIPRSAVEVNSSNKGGLTPLDILGIFQSEADEREIEEILRESGAMKAKESQTTSQESAICVNEESRSRSPAKKLLDYFKYDTIKDSPGSVRNTLLVLVVLIATATYQAVLSPPGGVWQDDNSSTGKNNGTPHVAGESIMGYHNPKSYRIFLICNSVGFFTSLHMINFLTIGFPMRLELQISMTSLVFTYNTSMIAIAPRLSNLFIVVAVVMPCLAPIATVVLRNFFKAPKFKIPPLISRLV
ncbi:putative cyclin-dependent kinases regulatory subunit 1-like [Capsicum annuum]|uniref:ankyrin repeat-containing protein BDA1 n=1 Tax=Capsicum annuum TaxID=4072 RepID=UPI001FB0A298|nr:ankyrin repeat-containing protein BDA1 [Capsicum annuum]KAF3682334.1 putative cyclin-dependent kinases regulatory subunit 1-like [Capsicum annuum]